MSSLVAVADYLKNALEAATQLGFEDVFFGDQEMIPRTPAVAVDPSDMQRDLAGVATGGMTLNTMTVYVYIYHGPLQSPQITRRECDQLAEAVMEQLHKDLQLGGLVIHGYCTSLESGAASRGSVMLRTHRITWQGISKTGVKT